MNSPIGIFDSGYGGLTILEKIRRQLPQYDYIYLGDNARAPYGTRTFKTVYKFTRQAVDRLFGEGCPLVILACNTASAKALRTIQQKDLPLINHNDDAHRRVLGVIRPTVENVGALTITRHVGVLGTPGTIRSESYTMEINKLYPDIAVTGEACPSWVPIVENGRQHTPQADRSIQKHIRAILKADPQIDVLILGCTHYPLLQNKIRQHLPPHITLLAQGQYVADALALYLRRHPEIETVCTKNHSLRFYTTGTGSTFAQMASRFLHQPICAEHLAL